MDDCFFQYCVRLKIGKLFISGVNFFKRNMRLLLVLPSNSQHDFEDLYNPVESLIHLCR